MEPVAYYIAITLICIILIIYTNHVSRDHFQTKREKAYFNLSTLVAPFSTN